MTQDRKKLLFVCSRNRWRSPTAEHMFSRFAGLEVRARGLSAKAVRRVGSADVLWADLIFVMEADHKKQLVDLFRAEVGDRTVHVLGIPDQYQFMDPVLVGLLETAVRAVIGDSVDVR